MGQLLTQLIVTYHPLGELGRYPIHFHMCDDVSGSLVAKNSILGSNQRCVVVHGTHNLTVLENIAYETRGHCYITEDGGEMDNKFIRNLGASTRAAQRLVRSFETDRSNPSTFWCSNPVNSWIENVAAGSESSGFWFELQDSVRPPTLFLETSAGLRPRRQALKEFRANAAHSNRKHGVRKFTLVVQPQQSCRELTPTDFLSFNHRNLSAWFSSPVTSGVE